MKKMHCSPTAVKVLSRCKNKKKPNEDTLKLIADFMGKKKKLHTFKHQSYVENN